MFFIYVLFIYLFLMWPSRVKLKSFGLVEIWDYQALAAREQI